MISQITREMLEPGTTQSTSATSIIGVILVWVVNSKDKPVQRKSVGQVKLSERRDPENLSYHVSDSRTVFQGIYIQLGTTYNGFGNT